MNNIEHYVTEVLAEPEFKFGRWWVHVMANAYGRIDEDQIMCKTREEALGVNVGYKYDA